MESEQTKRLESQAQATCQNGASTAGEFALIATQMDMLELSRRHDRLHTDVAALTQKLDHTREVVKAMSESDESRVDGIAADVAAVKEYLTAAAKMYTESVGPDDPDPLAVAARRYLEQAGEKAKWPVPSQEELQEMVEVGVKNCVDHLRQSTPRAEEAGQWPSDVVKVWRLSLDKAFPIWLLKEDGFLYRQQGASSKPFVCVGGGEWAMDQHVLIYTRPTHQPVGEKVPDADDIDSFLLGFTGLTPDQYSLSGLRLKNAIRGYAAKLQSDLAAVRLELEAEKSKAHQFYCESQQWSEETIRLRAENASVRGELEEAKKRAADWECKYERLIGFRPQPTQQDVERVAREWAEKMVGHYPGQPLGATLEPFGNTYGLYRFECAGSTMRADIIKALVPWLIAFAKATTLRAG